MLPLQQVQVNNIAKNNESLLEDLSMEQMVALEPEFIFIATMGEEDAAQEQIKNTLLQHPAWSNLKAVKNDNVVFLPKELFHYKPNEKWG